MPSLYESTANTGEVASSNFTTLYNASGLSVPNAGAGSITGNLNVGGNLTVQGSSLLIGDVTLQSTLSLPNYTFPAPDGTTDQVLVTDGNGNLYWSDVSAIPGADYNISATVATGGANLTLANTAGFSDSVKLASGTNMSIVRTDANTITISTIADNIPDGTANGQMLVWQNSAWTANNEVTFSAFADRTRFINNIPSASVSVVDLLRQVSGTLADGALVGSLFGFTDGSPWNGVTNPRYTHRTMSEYDTGGNPVYRIQADPVGNFVAGSTTVYSQLRVDNDYIGLRGNEVILNFDLTGAPTEDGIFRVNRGSSTDATLTWNETTDTWDFNNSVVTSGDLAVNGGDITTTATTFNLLNTTATTVNAFGASTATNIGAATGTTTLGNNLDVNGETVRINANDTAADSYLYMKGSTEYLKWDNTNSRFELSDQLYITQTDIPAILERRNVSTDISPSEQKSSIRLINRITDALSNDVINTGPGITFARTSGVSDATERLFASMGSSWNGTDKTASLAFTWSNDNYAEPTPGSFPGSYTLLDLNSNNTQFENDSLFVDYSAAGNFSTATSIITSNTLVFGSAHGFAVGERIKYMSTTQNGLTQYTYYYVLSAGFTTTQCRLSLTTTGSAITLTNGTGLTLNFAELVNQVGINNSNPGYTLDVNGNANIAADFNVDGGTLFVNSTTSRVGINTYSPGYTLDVNGTLNSVGVVTVQSDTITMNTDKTNLNVQLNFGRAAPNGNAVIRWNATSNTFEWSENGSTWHQFIDATLTAPFYNGQLLSYRNGEWVNDNRVDTTLSTERNVFNYRPLSPSAGFNTSLYLRKDYSNAAIDTPGVGTYADGAGSALSFQVVSDTQAPPGGAVGSANQFATIAGIYSSTNPAIELRTSINNGTASPAIATFDSTIIDLAGSTLTLNSENTGAATSATIAANRGSTGADATLIWDETTGFWTFNNNVYGSDQIVAGVSLATNGNNIYFNNEDGTAADCFITVKKPGVGDPQIKWNEATDRWQTSVDGSTYLNIPNQNLDIADDVSFAGVTVDSITTFNSQTTTTTALTTVQISGTTRNSQKAIIRIIDNVTGEIQMLEALAFYKGTTAYLTTYAEMYTSAALATFTASISAGTLSILATPASTNSTTFTVSRISLT
ncbi:hypothetical protein UFOVP592_43 [uncultured Caudovirales phage]|uniref:Uncharacterized protein n=1 Tax=uncultured Caudovirales phage TaxID=2100421 RepID=A0A6J5MZE1_9CAUD|nr:hypothetical protein UFOVP592_43 [uncultured Caudovirales phage]